MGSRKGFGGLRYTVSCFRSWGSGSGLAASGFRCRRALQDLLRYRAFPGFRFAAPRHVKDVVPESTNHDDFLRRPEIMIHVLMTIPVSSAPSSSWSDKI